MRNTNNEERLRNLLLRKKRKRETAFSEHPPRFSAEGDLWYNTTTDEVFIKYEGSWVRVGYKE